MAGAPRTREITVSNYTTVAFFTSLLCTFVAWSSRVVYAIGLLFSSFIQWKMCKVSWILGLLLFCYLNTNTMCFVNKIHDDSMRNQRITCFPLFTWLTRKTIYLFLDIFKVWWCLDVLKTSMCFNQSVKCDYLTPTGWFIRAECSSRTARKSQTRWGSLCPWRLSTSRWSIHSSYRNQS